MTRWPTIIRTSLGLLLIVAAGLKFYGSGASAMPGVGWFAQPGVQLAAAGCELFLGLWLLSGVAPRAGRLVAILLLLVFLALNLTKVAEGAPSCGCLGELAVPPMYTAIFESLYVTALVFLPPKAEWSASDGHAIGIASLVALLFAGYFGLEYLLPGRQEGDFKFQIPSEEPEAVTTFEYTWMNPESEPVQLTFFQSSCGCMKAQPLPVWVAPAETATITIAFTARSKPGDFVQKFAILTSKTTLRGAVYGRIREPAGE